MESHIFVSFFFILCLHSCIAIGVPKELKDVLQISIDYYNKSMSLAESVGMVEKYYEIEREEGVFYHARLRIAPEKMLEISEGLETIEFQLKGKVNSKNKVVILEQLKELEKDLEHNFGARDKNFRIKKDDPLIKNMRAVERMRKHFDGLMDEFKDYTRVQLLASKVSKVLKDFGIYLHPRNLEPEFYIIASAEEAEKLLKELPKSKDFEHIKGGYLNDIIEKLKGRLPQGLAQQTTQEIKTLEKAKNGEVIDPVSESMLEGFIPELNKKAVLIITKMKAFEQTMDVIDTESQNYGNYLWEKRGELYQLLDTLRKNVNLIKPRYEL